MIEMNSSLKILLMNNISKMKKEELLLKEDKNILNQELVNSEKLLKHLLIEKELELL